MIMPRLMRIGAHSRTMRTPLMHRRIVARQIVAVARRQHRHLVTAPHQFLGDALDVNRQPGAMREIVQQADQDFQFVRRDCSTCANPDGVFISRTPCES